MRTSRTLAPVFLLATTLAAQAPAGTAGRGFEFDVAWKALAQDFRTGCEAHGVVGAALMFVEGDQVLGFEPFGAADRTAGRAVDRDTIFHWASITKTFTGIAVMQLRDRGRLRLDEPAVDFVPELRAVHDPFGDIADIELHHLMSHSAGFRAPTWPWGGDQPWQPYEPTSFSQLVAMMPYTEILFAPGSRFWYSNPGVTFLGRAIERLSGDDYEVYMQKNVLAPLGMTHAYFDITPYHLQRFRSHSYSVQDGATKDLGADFDTGVTVSNGGLNAPLTDMARYLAFLLGAVPKDSDAAHVLARESLEEMWQPVLPTGGDGTEHVGLSFFLQDHDDQRIVTHTGSQHGFEAFLYVHPESGTGAIGVFNTNSGRPLVGAMRTACLDRLSIPMTPR